MIAGITILNIINSMSMSVSARMKQYGILREMCIRDISRHTLSTELIFIRFALPQNDFDTCIRRRNEMCIRDRHLRCQNAR